jgi:hypothetical protein
VYVNYQNYTNVENNKFVSIPAIIIYEFSKWSNLSFDLIQDSFNDIVIDLKW